MTNERPRIDSGDGYEVPVFEGLLDGRSRLVAAIVNAVVFADQSSNLDLLGFRLIVGDPIVADMGIGGYHDLTVIRGVGKDLLVARGTGVKTDFTRGGANLSGGLTVVDRSVFE